MYTRVREGKVSSKCINNFDGEGHIGLASPLFLSRARAESCVYICVKRKGARRIAGHRDIEGSLTINDDDRGVRGWKSKQKQKELRV